MGGAFSHICCINLWHLWSLTRQSRSPRYSERFDYVDDEVEAPLPPSSFPPGDSERFHCEGDEAEASSPPSSSTPPVNREDETFQYDVFLSFRGSDTRNSFTSYLYYALEDKGIITFIDSEKLEKGQKVDKLFECIRKSKIFVPIFSKGYADSKWCLKEIAEIIECKRLIIPIFLGVEPTEVRHQTGPFADAFRSYLENEVINKEEARKWSAALTEAGKVSGYTLANIDGNGAKLIRVIVKRILTEVNMTATFVAKHPVGLDAHIADMMEVLEVEAQDDVKMVGIHGIGGIGKTTLAKAVYNKIFNYFDACSFISNVREASQQSTGLIPLQKQLLCDVFKDENVKVSSIHQGIATIKRQIKSRKVLLVLDDTDDQSQLEALAGGIDWFYPGSRIIVTTRDKQVLEASRILKQYELKGLDAMQSLQLFSWHAFGKGKPNAKFAKMSKEVAAISAGVPLALEIFGSHFFDLNEIKEWKDMLEKLKKYQDKHIHEKLKISYDVLDEEEKKVFLDIACFFIGHERKLATLMWEDCKFFPNITIKVLVHKSLVSIDDQTEEFKMHVHIRDMGRKIVQDESLYTPGMCSSRLQMDDDTLDILQNKRGIENVEAIQLSWSPFVYSMSIEAESFATMPQLRMLQLGKMGTRVTLKGQYDGFPKGLRWLQWNIPRGLESLPDDLHLENIVVLDLSWSSITQVWSLQTSARCKAFEKLKVLRLAYCRNLTSCPDFGSIRMPLLQELNFEGCENISKIHPCIGLLKSLTHLNLSCCTSLKKLPEEIYELTSLEELDLGYCYGLTTLPSWLGDSKSLKRHLLGKLKVLKLQGCTNLTIWSDFRSMPCLQQLYFDGCEIITELSPSIEQLKSLIYLDLRSCNSLKELPQEVGQLTSLKELNLGYCSQISSLPVSMGHLKQLKWLSLEKCSSLKEVPECIMSLDQLEILILDRCEKLKILAHFPPSLTKLYAGDCHQLEIIADVSNLKGLQELDLNNCERLVDIPGIEQLNCLRSLCLGGCKSLHHSFFERVQELDKLEILELYNCENLTKHRDFASSLNWLSNLKKYLRKLDLSWTDIEELPGLDRLEILRVAHCNRLKFLPKLPPSLTGLDAKWCTELRRIEDVSSAKGLWGLYLSGCTKLVDVPGIEQLEGLQDLGLGGCRNLRYSFFERLQEANFQHLERFCVPGRLIDGGPSYHKSVSFLLPKQFNSGLLYLYVEERRLHSIRSKLVERNGATRLPDKSIPTDEVIDDKLSRSVVRVDITTADAQFPFTTFIVKWDVSRKVLKATFGWDSELMRMASEGRFEGNNVDDNDAQWSRTMMMMRVSMDSCVLCSGDLLIHKATDKACFNWLDRDPCEGYNIVMVEFQRRPY